MYFNSDVSNFIKTVLTDVY